MSKRKFRKIRHHTALPSFAERVKGVDSAKKAVKSKLSKQEFVDKMVEHGNDLLKEEVHTHGEHCNHG